MNKAAATQEAIQRAINDALKEHLGRPHTGDVLDAVREQIASTLKEMLPVGIDPGDVQVRMEDNIAHVMIKDGFHSHMIQQSVGPEFPDFIKNLEKA